MLVVQPPHRTVQGYGDFPRAPVVAPGADGSTLALYLVEGDRATRLHEYEGLRAGHDRVTVWLSPDERHIAALLRRADGSSVTEVVDITGRGHHTLDRGAGDLALVKGAAYEDITSLAWMDDAHVLYSKVQWPGSKEWTSSWEAGVLPPIEGEVWLSDIESRERRLLATGRIHRVLGASADGQKLYVTRLIPRFEQDRAEGLALVDLETGELQNLWPQEEDSPPRYQSFELVETPNGTQRALFATVHSDPPAIWLGDLESGQAEVIWTIDRGHEWSSPDGKKSGVLYDVPGDFLWSPHSDREFIYLGGAFVGGVRRVDLDAGKAEPVGEVEPVRIAHLRLLAWTPEGIVMQSQNVVRLLDEGGTVLGEIRLSGNGSPGSE